jgi:hypothetical protein
LNGPLIKIINDDDEDSGWPIESWLKLIAVVIGMLGELVTGFEPSGTFVMHNGQVSELPPAVSSSTVLYSILCKMS